MAQYQNLQATIDAQIKANGIQAITGPVLNAVLSSMVNVLGDGYRFRGIASPADNPGTPDNRVFYLAAGAGTYAKFGGLVVPDDGYIYILTFDAAWALLKTGMAAKSYVDDVLTQSPFKAGAGSGSAVLSAGANLAPGKQAVGIGSQASANGDYSLVYGAACKADGKRGHAGGYGSQAPAENAVALGDHVEATAKDEAAFGRYNRHNSDFYQLLFSVGMGTAADRRNAIQIDDDGKMFVRGVGGYDGGVVKGDGTVGMSLQDMLCHRINGIPNPADNSIIDITVEEYDMLGRVLAVADDAGFVYPKIALSDVIAAREVIQYFYSSSEQIGIDAAAAKISGAFGIIQTGECPSAGQQYAVDTASVYIIWADLSTGNCYATYLDF